MKQHILRLLNYNKGANQQLINTILLLPEKEPSLKLVSHLITAQDKWLNRITPRVADSEHQWFGKVFGQEDIMEAWIKSISSWISLIEEQDEDQLQSFIFFTRPADGTSMKVKLVDIALQVNYHNMHHRAQVNKLISAQGITPPPTDFIFTAISEA